jgi:hypothetical protein
VSLTSDVRTYLIDQGIAASDTTSDWAILIGGLSDQLNQPHMAILETSGFAPINVMGSDYLSRPAFQILVRGEAGQYANAEAKAHAVYDTLHRASFAYLQTVEAAQNPVWLGYDEDHARPQWSLNFTTIRNT